MTDPTPQRDQPRRDDDRPVMGDHLDLETDDPVATNASVESGDTMARLLVPGIIVLVIVLIIIAFFLFD